MKELIPASTRKYLYPTDTMTLGLCAMFAVISAANAGAVKATVFGVPIDREAGMSVVFALLCAALPFLFKLTNASANPTVRFVRLFYPQGLYLLFFSESIVLSQIIYHRHTLDRFFASIDKMVFTFQPSIRFHQSFAASPAVNEIFFFGYFSFFALITVGWWILYGRRQLDRALWAFAATTMSFSFLYLFYCFFPVAGPKYYFPTLHQEWYRGMNGYVFAFLLKNIFGSMDLGGAAFPSSHVAVSTLALLLNFRLNPRLARFLLPFTLLLYLSTIYLYAHYVVDVVAGLILGVAFYFGMPALLSVLAPQLGRAERFIAALYRIPALAASVPTQTQ
jgi:membrane-associated phospholipid phosphatase